MTVQRLLGGTSTRVFIIYPIALVLIELLLRGGELRPQPLGVPLLAWGYLQFRLSGNYRNQHGGGGPGLGNPPERLVTSGIYAYTRNPMYLALLIFLAGLALTLMSWIGALLLVAHVPWFQRRVGDDERRLHDIFGDDYDGYTRRVKRWIPGIV